MKKRKERYLYQLKKEPKIKMITMIVIYYIVAITMVVITIKDNGIGIDKDILPILFTKFASKSFQGTGLGLYICKSIVEAHGGKIWAKNNEDGKGATFSFSLPFDN